MKKLQVTFLLCGAIFLFESKGFAQDDETRQATGLPTKLGEGASNREKGPLSGKITLQGFDNSQPKPRIFVIVYFSGALLERRQVNDSGNYFVPSVPRDAATLAVEVDGVEVGTYPLLSTSMGNIRQDVDINWTQVLSAKAKKGVISAKDFYPRSDENTKAYNKAVNASKEKKSDNAITLFKQLLQSDPKDFVAWTELGTLFFKNDKYSDAEEAYNKALEQKPDFIVALLNLGKLYLNQKQPDKAIVVLTKAVEIQPSSADANHYLGEAYLQVKKGSKAVVYLNEALKLAPVEKAEIHLRLATLYFGAGLKEKAIEEYKLFLTKVPNHPEKDKIEKFIKENTAK